MSFLEEVVRQAMQRAPWTIRGLVLGGIVGALFRGPRGALLGGVLGGLWGYCADVAEERQRVRDFNVRQDH